MVKRRPSILLVEDDLSLRDSLSAFLRDSGFDTLEAGTLREGFALLRNKRPCLCLLDMNLPDGSGRDLLRYIHQQKLPVRVIVMTAFDLQGVRPQDVGDALAGWLTKPVNPMDLLQLVEIATRPGGATGWKPASPSGVDR